MHAAAAWWVHESLMTAVVNFLLPAPESGGAAGAGCGGGDDQPAEPRPLHSGQLNTVVGGVGEARTDFAHMLSAVLMLGRCFSGRGEPKLGFG